MSKLKMLVELDYDAKLHHGQGKEEEDWFAENILSDYAGELLMHSNVLGCTLGKVKVLVVHDWPQNAGVTGAEPKE